MKRFYRPYKFWSFETVPVALFALILLNAMWPMLSNRKPWTGAEALFFIGVLIVVFGIIPRVSEWLFTMRAYDDGDSIVVRRRTTTARIPFNKIQRVDYVTGAGQPLRVRLHLTEPCVFGEKITIPISPVTIGPRHSEVADEIHRRSQCCRNNEAHIRR